VQKHRYKVSFLLTALLYIIPVATYLYFLQKHIFSVNEPHEEVIELSLSQFVPEAPPQQSEAPVQPEQIVEEKPEPVEEEVEKEEVPEPEPEPEPEKVEPVVKEIPVTTPVEKKKPIPKKVQKKKKYKKKPRHKKQRISGGSPHYSAAQKNRFLAAIRQKIDRAKSYPRIAQKRGIQGVVKVSFTILPNGDVGTIRVSGPRIFHRSARQAVERAFPVNAKKAPLRLPAKVNLSLRYRLR
jgi:protein TonB